MSAEVRLSEPSLPKVRIGISACLLGQEVRYNGGHKRDDFLIGTFGKYVDWVAVCPEVELGMGTPRSPIRLERRQDQIRLIMPSTGEDYTEAMRAFSRQRVEALARLDLDGYVLKKDSPSCGMERVKVYPAGGAPFKDGRGRGLFAEELMARLPDLPVEEEARLNAPALRESFFARVIAHYCRREGEKAGNVLAELLMLLNHV